MRAYLRMQHVYVTVFEPLRDQILILLQVMHHGCVRIQILCKTHRESSQHTAELPNERRNEYFAMGEEEIIGAVSCC